MEDKLGASPSRVDASGGIQSPVFFAVNNETPPAPLMEFSRAYGVSSFSPGREYGNSSGWNREHYAENLRVS